MGDGILELRPPKFANIHWPSKCYIVRVSCVLHFALANAVRERISPKHNLDLTVKDLGELVGFKYLCILVSLVFVYRMERIPVYRRPN